MVSMLILAILIIFELILLFWLISNIISKFHGCVYKETDDNLASFALNKASLKKNDTLIDLGSGNGEVLLIANTMQARSIGYEISPIHYLISLGRCFCRKNTKIIFGDITKADLAHADVIFCYLMPKLLQKLAPKFKIELPKKIISIDFEIKGLEHPKVYQYNNRKVYIYSLRSRAA